MKDMIERGDVYYADFSPVPGLGKGGLHPVLIFEADVGGRYSPTVMVLEITSKMPQTLLSTQVKIDASESDVSDDSVLLLGKIRALDKGRLREKIGHLDKQIMKDVDAVILESFGIGEEK